MPFSFQLSEQIRLDFADGDVTVDDAVRTDRGTLRGAKRTDEGYIRTDAFIARPGVYVYRLADGTERRELVPPETLHDKASLDTLTLKPVTNNHPDPRVYPDMVTTENVKELSAGTTGERYDIDEDGRPFISITVQHEALIDDVEAGKREMSPGYRCGLILKPGVHPDFGKYDAIQVNRRYNHLAVVDRGRGGSTVHIHIDGADCIGEADKNDHEDANDMTLIEMLIEAGMAKQDAERLAAAPADVLAKADAFDALPTDEEVAAAALKTREERVDLDDVAGRYELDPAETVKLDNDELKVAILAKAEVEIPKLDGISEEAALACTWAAFDPKPAVEDRNDARNDALDDDDDDDDDDASVNHLDALQTMRVPDYNFQPRK